MVELIKLIKDETEKVIEDLEIIFMPSTDDLTNYYPMPQPKDTFADQVYLKNIQLTSNPAHLSLKEGHLSKIKIDMMNMDLHTYIDENRTGNAIKSIMQDNLDNYLKQPFTLTNTLDEPFDETNLPGLYNNG